MSSYSSPHTPNEAESDVEFSLYSLSSELDLDFACRGITKPQIAEECLTSKIAGEDRKPESLLVLTAKAIAQHFPFEVVESSTLTIPEELQRLIAFHSFPTDEDDIWLYSCLSSGECYEFDQGEALWADKAVRECVQIGFHLSATVLTGLHIAPALNPHQNGRVSDLLEGTLTTGAATDPYHVNFSANPTSEARRIQTDPDVSQPDNADPNLNHTTDRGGLNIEPGYPAHRVSLTFDRGRITSCSCTCTFDVEERCANLTSPRYFGDGDGTRNAYSTNAVSFPVNGSANQNSMFGTIPYQSMSFTGPMRNGQLSGSGLVEPDTTEVQASGAPSSSYLRPSQMPLRSAAGIARYALTKHASPFGSAGIRWGFQPNATTTASRPNRDLVALTASGFTTAGALTPPGTWCSHVVATCLMRIRQPDQVLLRAPISESLSKLSKEDLQKFAQNLICYVGPKKILPAAQCILDQLLDSSDNPMKSSNGAPDPTAGGALGDAAAWCFDGAVLEEKLRVTLRRFWASKPALLYPDIGSFNSHFPVSVENFHGVLKSLRSNIPRGLWDLLSIIGDMMRRRDNNGVLLLEIVTRCILDMRELMSWWYLVQLDPCFIPRGVPLCQKDTQYAALWLCEEIVQLWRLACLNPELRPFTGMSIPGRFPSGSSVTSAGSRDTMGTTWLLHQLTRRLKAFHIFALEQAGFRVTHPIVPPESTGLRDACTIPTTSDSPLLRNEDDYHRFQGFKPALAACLLTWPCELPPTHGLSSTAFRACIPTFAGARLASCKTKSSATPPDFAMLGECCTSLNMFKTLTDVPSKYPNPMIDEQDPTAHLFVDLPTPRDDVELAFAKFQALNAHGHAEQALIWARYLACRLLHLSNEMICQAELIAFETVTEHRSASSLRSSPKVAGSTTDATSGSTNTNWAVNRATGPDRNANGSRRAKRNGLAVANPAVGSTSASPAVTNPVTSDSTQSTRSERTTRVTDSTDSSSDRAPESNTQAGLKAVEWATKVNRLLDQIRWLMECLTRGYDDSLANPTRVSSASRITSSGRALLMFRGPDPVSVDLHLDDTASPVAQQTVHHSSDPIRDDWICIDIELAFRLGFLGLSLPRPPTLSPTIEVRLFDQEIGILTRLCRLPLHRACPHVLSSIRHEAMRLARSLSIYQTDILVPYNLATYVFHQLVGTYRTSHIVAHLSDPDALFTEPTFTEVAEAGSHDVTNGTGPGATETIGNTLPTASTGDRATERALSCPVLSTGAILDGSGLPLVVSNHLRKERELALDEQNKGKDGVPRRLGGTQSAYLRQMDLAQLGDAVLADADLGFSAVLSVLAVRSRVPETTYTFFVEGQWAQLNALAVYMLRHYRDDLAKLDRILLHLLDRYYNPNFLAPPLWACLTLTPRDLMRYALPETDSTNEHVNSNAEVTATADNITNVRSTLSPSNRSGLLFAADTELSSVIGATLATGPFNSTLLGSHSATLMDPTLPTDQSAVAAPDSASPVQLFTNNLEVVTSEAVVPTPPPPSSSIVLTSESVNTLLDPVPPTMDPTPLTQTATSSHDVSIEQEDPTFRETVRTPCQQTASPTVSPAHMQPRAASDLCIFDPASASEDTDTFSDSKKWTEAFRCATLRNPKQFGCHSVGMAAVDTSAPETTSSDNSPAATRRISATRSVQSTLTGPTTDDARMTENIAAARNGNATTSGPSTPGSAFLPRTGLSTLRSRSRASGAGAGPILAAHVPVSSYSSTSISEDDDHVPTRTDPLPNLRQQPPQTLLEHTNANAAVAEESIPVVSNENLPQQSGASNTPCCAQAPVDDDVDEEEEVEDVEEAEDDNDDGMSEPVAEVCSSTTTRPSWTTDDVADLVDPSDQWADVFKRLPPQPLSNSIAFHVFNLAKLVRKLAGGPRTSGSVFMAEPDANGTVHRNLHLAAFQIGLFGLGLYNSLLPSWQSRTFSRDSGWISQQVFEIGIPAACILYHSWQQHLTAAELAGIAFQLSRENNRALVDIAAELCLASLSMCTTLKPLEIYRAISQCEEHSSLTLERGLLRIESSENRTPYGILPEIHFFLARSWFSLHQSVMEEYNKALETLQQQMQKARSKMQQQPQQPGNPIDSDVDGTSKPAEPQSSSASIACSSCPSTSLTTASIAYEGSISGSAVQTTPSVTWPSHSTILQAPFPPVTLPPQLQQQQQQQQACGMALTGEQSMIYPTSPLNSNTATYGHIPGLQHHASLPIYPSLFYYPQPGVGFNQTQVYGQYRPPPPSQPALLPTPGQSNPLIYAQTAAFGQVPCMQPNAAFSFHPNSAVRVPITRMLPVSPQQPQQPVIPPNFTRASGLLAPNSQMMPPTLNQLPIGPFNPPVPCVTAPQTSQPVVSAISMFLQLQRDQLTEPALYAANMNSLITSQAPVSTAMCAASYGNRDTLGAADLSSLSAPTTLGGTSFVGPLPTQCGPTAVTQLTLTQRLASMSNASSSVVVHPALSDRGSSTSETDSSRLADSVVEGGLSEDHPSAVRSHSATNVANEATTVNSSTSLTSNSRLFTDEPNTDDGILSMLLALKSLDAKAHQYLRRSYLCATSAIKKIFLNHSSSSSSFDSSTGSHTSSAGRGARGHKSHHHHHHHPHASTMTQPRRCHDASNSSAASCTNTGGDSASSHPSLSSNHLLSSNASCVSNENGRIKRILDVPMESHVAKAWNANILWTLDVASNLGPMVVYEYCNLILQCVQCPLLMHELAVKVIDYFKRISSATAAHHTQSPGSGFPDPSTGTMQPDNSNRVHPTSMYYPGQEIPSNQYYGTTFFTHWPNFPPPPTDAWPNPSNRTESLVPFPPPNNYMAPVQSCAVCPPAPWRQPLATVVSCPVQGDSMNELMVRYQQLGFAPPEQTTRGLGPIQDPCLMAQSQHCTTPSTQPPQPQQQHDPLSLPYQAHPTGPAISPWSHSSVSHPTVTYPSTAGINQATMGPVSSASEMDPVKKFVGQELIERFVNRTHALFHKFIEHRLQYIGQGQTEWDEFVDLILKAYNVHLSMPATDYGLHWNNLLTRIRRHHKCSASLWQRILAGIQTADLKRSG